LRFTFLTHRVDRVRTLEVTFNSTVFILLARVYLFFVEIYGVVKSIKYDVSI